MKAKTVWIVTGAALLAGGVMAFRGGKSMHERCKEACARMAGKGSSEEGEARHGCGPAACKK